MAWSIPFWTGLKGTRQRITLGTTPRHSDVPQGSEKGAVLFRFFMNNLPDAFEALTLLFVDDIKMVAGPAHNMKFHTLFTAVRDWSKKSDISVNRIKCNYLTIGREVPLKF